MSLSLEMFAIAPARGRAELSPRQLLLLTGNAHFLHAIAAADHPVTPSIVITRRGWEQLQAERRDGGDTLRAQWVACLFRLVLRQGMAPRLVVRTTPAIEANGLFAPRFDLPAPMSEADAVDPDLPLGRAIDAALRALEGGSWAGTAPSWEHAQDLILVQAQAEGSTVRFLSRDPQTGALGPVPMVGEPLPLLGEDAGQMIASIDGVAGRHLALTAVIAEGVPTIVSARPVEATAAAELEAAVDRVNRGTWTEREAVARIEPARLAQLLHPRLTSGKTGEPIATGLGVSPGAATGMVVFTSEDAARVRARGRHCILVAVETGPGDIEGMKAATGILTARGGMTSHAAVIARITGKPCVAGVRSLQVDVAGMSCTIGGKQFRQGDRITIEGSDGHVYGGSLPLSQPHIGGAIGTLLGWSDVSRKIAVRTNAETVEAARTALSFGAEGIGLARSEHMFFSGERMVALQRLILSEDENDRAEALKGLVVFQTGDYSALFSTMAGRPVTVRLFDPPLHEFLPRSEEDVSAMAASLGLELRVLRNRLERLAEVNPMLGHRGVRLAITYPEILEMQLQAVLSGLEAAARTQIAPVTVEMMVPFVSTASEVAFVRERVMALVQESGVLDGSRALFSFGTMIELPRAALRASEIATAVDFFSFGTNDLTQTTYGISRDDAPAFLSAYQRKGLYEADPFVTIDQKGVGELIAIAITRGRAANPNLKIGICGEHAGDPASLRFFAGLDVDYVSCSPYRVPVARLALAQAGQ